MNNFEDNIKSILITHSEEIIKYLLANSFSFSIVIVVENLKFEPRLPNKIYKKFESINMLYLNEYSIKTAIIRDGSLIFGTNFGEEFYISKVTTSLLNIMQIIVGEHKVIYVNPFIDIKEKKNLTKESLGRLLKREKNRAIANRKGK